MQIPDKMPRFSRRGFVALGALILGAIAILWTVATVWLLRERSLEIEKQSAISANIALAVASHAESTIRGAEVLLRSIALAYQEGTSPTDLAKLGALNDGPNNPYKATWIVNEEGFVVFSTSTTPAERVLDPSGSTMAALKQLGPQGLLISVRRQRLWDRIGVVS